MKLLLSALLLAIGINAAAAPVKLAISCGSIGQDFESCHQLTQAWSKKTGNSVELITVPSPYSSMDTLSLYRERFEAKSPDLDVMMVDVVWPGVLQQAHLLDLKPYSKGVENNHFPVMVANNTVDGKLLAMPWFTEAGLLYYRKDLLEQYHRPVPKTWEEMTSTAKIIQTAERAKGRKNLWGYVFQGRAYEGLTCNATEWIASYNGGHFIESDGRVSINNPQAAKALDQAASWIGTISPKSTLDMAEEEVRAQFQEGNAVFMRNWPFAWSLARMDRSVIKNKVGVASLPQGGADGQHAASLGGWGLAVSKYSKHPNEAADLVLFLTSEQAQKNRAITGAYNPTIPALYHDGDVLNASPLFGELLEVFNHAVARPSTVTGAQYNEASEIIQNATHAVLEHQLSGAQAVQQMEEDLSSIGFQR